MKKPHSYIWFSLVLVVFLGGYTASIYYDKVFAITSFFAALGGGVAVVNYVRSVRIKRLEWLLALFHRYMDEKKFRRIRYIIVFRVQPEFELLKDLMQNRAQRKVNQPADKFEDSLIMDMDDYLNFFELIATLWSKGELKSNEIKMLYHDYIKYLWQMDFTHAYITNWGFECLSKLATELFGDGPLEDR